MCPGFDSRTRRHMWVQSVVGSLPCSERFFSGYSGFPLFSKTDISKFQFDPDYCQILYHEPLAQVIAQTLPVFGIKFAFTFFFKPMFFSFSFSSTSYYHPVLSKLAVKGTSCQAKHSLRSMAKISTASS